MIVYSRFAKVYSFILRICNTSATTLNRKLCHDPPEFVRLPNSCFFAC